MSMKEEFTAIDMATAAANGFRAGQSVGVSDGWMPIDTAPKDRLIMLWDGEHTVGCWCEDWGKWNPCLSDKQPTFWMELPAAPTVKAEQPDCVYCQGHGDVTRTSGQTAESYAEHNEECPECKGTGLSPSLSAAGSAGSAVEEVEVVGYRFFHVDHGYIFRRTHTYEGNPSLEAHSLMTVAQHERIVASLTSPAQTEQSGLVEAELAIRKFESANWHGSKGYHAGLLKAADIVAQNSSDDEK